VKIAELVLSYVKVLIWPGLVLGALAHYRRDVRELIKRTRSLDTPAGSIEFAEHARELLEEAAEDNNVATSPGERRGVLRRLEHAAEYLTGGRILWADDHPRGNSGLIRLFRSVGMEVETVLSTEQAMDRLRSRSYDILLTDLKRGGDAEAGNTLLRELTMTGIDIPAVVHSARVQIDPGVNRRAFATTNSTDEVVHYVIDLMERARFS
jgi:CheY-like chemotaxis protein